MKNEIQIVSVRKSEGEKSFKSPIGFCEKVIYSDAQGNNYNAFISSRLKRNLENSFNYKQKNAKAGKLFITLNEGGKIEYEISHL